MCLVKVGTYVCGFTYAIGKDNVCFIRVALVDYTIHQSTNASKVRKADEQNGNIIWLLQERCLKTEKALT
jgi:hypothetical protein